MPASSVAPVIVTLFMEPKFQMTYLAIVLLSPVSFGGFQLAGTPLTLRISGRSADGVAPLRNVMLVSLDRSVAFSFRTIWPEPAGG